MIHVTMVMDGIMFKDDDDDDWCDVLWQIWYFLLSLFMILFIVRLVYELLF